MEARACRLGLHHWARFKEPPGSGGTWVTRCRRCGAERSGPGPISFVVFAVVFVVALTAFWWAPFLGAVLMMGAIAGLGWAVLPLVVARLARWLSVGR